MNGGPAQLDTFDLKPDAPDEIRGPYRPIETSVPGIRITEKLPRLARLAHHFALLRSATHPFNAHNSSAAYALSGHSPGSDANIRPTPSDHPTYGSVVARVLPKLGGMPPFVLTPTFLFDMGFPTPRRRRRLDRNALRSAAGRAQPHDGPLAQVGRIAANSRRARPARRSERQPFPRPHALRGQLDSAFAAAQTVAERSKLETYQAEALDVILSPATRTAFEVGREPEAMHERYGRSEMGQVLLLSRRLIEAGVRFVTANAVSNPENTTLSSFQIWDTHRDHFRLYNQNLMPELDQGLSALISDLDERGLLAETLIIVMGEMGRTPKINSNADGGRDHWGHAYSVLWAGGGIRGGNIVGATDRHAASVKDFPARPDDIAATLYELLGIPHDLVLAIRPTVRTASPKAPQSANSSRDRGHFRSLPQPARATSLA